MSESNRRKRRAKPNVQTRQELEAQHGTVWNEDELAAEYVTTAIISPDLVVVRRIADNQVGTMRCTDGLYHSFEPQQTAE